MSNVVVCALAIERNRVLLVSGKEGTLILPGGKRRRKESDVACLIRESNEELPHNRFTLGAFYGQFRGVTPHSNRRITAEVYLASYEGRPQPSAEIVTAYRYTYAEAQAHIVSQITQDVLERAIKDGLLTK